ALRRGHAVATFARLVAAHARARAGGVAADAVHAETRGALGGLAAAGAERPAVAGRAAAAGPEHASTGRALVVTQTGGAGGDALGGLLAAGFGRIEIIAGARFRGVRRLTQVLDVGGASRSRD